MMLIATIEVRTALPTATPTPAGPPEACVAVVAVDQDHDDREDQHLAERPQHVAGWQEQVEVVVVGARALPVELRHDESGREVRRQQADDVERDDRDETGDDPGRHEERQRRDRHHLERVDLLVIRIAPSWAVKPHPTVAASAMPATSGAISRVLKYADTKPENGECRSG